MTNKLDMSTKKISQLLFECTKQKGNASNGVAYSPAVESIRSEATSWEQLIKVAQWKAQKR